MARPTTNVVDGYQETSFAKSWNYFVCFLIFCFLIQVKETLRCIVETETNSCGMKCLLPQTKKGMFLDINCTMFWETSDGSMFLSHTISKEICMQCHTKTLHFTDSKYSIVEIFRDFDYHFLLDETREMIADVQKLCRNTPSISLDL